MKHPRLEIDEDLDDDDVPKLATFPMWRDGQMVDVLYKGSGTFKRLETSDLLPIAQVVATDTETTTKDGELVTDLIPVAFFNRALVLDHSDGVNVLDRYLELLSDRFGVFEERKSRTKQRPRNANGFRAGGRRGKKIPITLSVWFNLPYDVSRLFPDPRALRRIYAGADAWKFKVSDRIELEWTRYIDTSAPQFEWFVRDEQDLVITRVIGLDLTGYWKCSLEKALSAVGLKGKIDIEASVENVHDRAYETFSAEEAAKRKEYGLHDVDRTLALYQETANLLIAIDPRVVRKNGLIPASAPGAAARIMFAKAFDLHGDLTDWKRPPTWADRLGCESYYGGRAFGAKPGIYRQTKTFRGMTSLDLKSAYPSVMTLLPDPVTAKYERVEPTKKFNVESYRGLFGTLRVSGRCSDDRYPAFRIHQDNRLRYIAGEFRNLSVTIPEIVIGVARGSLEIDEVHTGVVIRGSSERSFFRHFVLELYAMKEAHGKGPLGLLAKLLMNSAYGKLIEVNARQFRWERAHPVPDIHENREEVALSILAILASDGFVDVREMWFGFGTSDDGREAIENRFAAAAATSKDPFEIVHGYLHILQDENIVRPTTSSISLAEFLRQARIYRTGAYFLPLYGAQITGLVSAELGAMAAATHAFAGDTDAVHVEWEPDILNSPRVASYTSVMQAAGYPAPRLAVPGSLLDGTTLGTWEAEMPNPTTESIIVRPKRYSHRYLDAKGKVAYKNATHGMARFTTAAAEAALHDTSLPLEERGERARDLRNEGIHEAMRDMLDARIVGYDTRRAPVKGRTAAMGKAIAGKFMSRHVEVKNPPVLGTEKTEEGWIRWQPTA